MSLKKVIRKSGQYLPSSARHYLSDVVSGGKAAVRHPLAAIGHIDDARWIDTGVLAITGWALPRHSGELFLSIHGGETLDLAETLTVQRPDVAAEHGNVFGLSAAESGFLACFAKRTLKPSKVSLVARENGKKRVLHQCMVTHAEFDPVMHAQWLFSNRTSRHALFDRYTNVDLPFLGGVMEMRNRALSDSQVERWTFGRVQPNPRTSVIVPLYGRWDFVEHQLLGFATDPEFQATTELIYVVDDPNILAGLLSRANEFFDLYDVPFSIVWGHANRGYSGANNLGASLAAGRFIAFLNSDAFPSAPGWLGALTSQLDQHPQFGVVAPRLLFPDGGLQHVGMEFRWNSTFDVWINDHPLLGLPPKADGTVGIVERHAVTGACMVVRREEFVTLGGFDTGYLIGDFEDSDLCLRYRAEGLLPGYYPGVELTHLERQSIKGAGDAEFRQMVTIFNAVRHQLRWGKMIEELAVENMREAAQ